MKFTSTKKNKSIDILDDQGRFADADTPFARSNNDRLNGKLIISKKHAGDFVKKIDQEEPQVIIAIKDIDINKFENVLIIGSEEGALALSFAFLHESSNFFIFDENSSFIRLNKRNLDKNEDLKRNCRVVSKIEIEELKNTVGIDVVIVTSRGHVSMDTIREKMIMGGLLLKNGGRLYLVSHKKMGAERHQNFLKSTFGDQVQIIGRGKGGYRILEAIKTAASSFPKTDGGKKEITFSVLDKTFSLWTDTSIFSRDKLDDGTKILLESLNLNTYKNMLDLGCGWGAIGIVAGAINNNGRVVMTDNDGRAVDLAKKNIIATSVANRVMAIASDNPRTIPQLFDLVLSNPPFHLDNEELKRLFEGAKEKMHPGANIFIVVEKTHFNKFTKILKETFGNQRIYLQKDNYFILASKN